MTGAINQFTLDPAARAGDRVAHCRFDGYVSSSAGTGVARLFLSLSDNTTVTISTWQPRIMFGIYRSADAAAAEPAGRHVSGENMVVNQLLDENQKLYLTLIADADITLGGYFTVGVLRLGR